MVVRGGFETSDLKVMSLATGLYRALRASSRERRDLGKVLAGAKRQGDPLSSRSPLEIGCGGRI